MEKEELTALENEQSALLKEFEDSKLGVDKVDEFILKYFKKKGVADPEATLKRMDDTFKKIDERYEILQKAKENGEERITALRKICDEIYKDKDPGVAGKELTQFILSLKGEKYSESEEPLRYEGFDAADLLRALDSVLSGREILALQKNEEDGKNGI